MVKSFKTAIVAIVFTGWGHQLMAQESDSTSLRPAFELEYTSEIQTDFEHSNWVNLLQLRAELPLSERLTFNVASVSIASTDEEPLINDLHGYSNIVAENVTFALAVAGFTWHINDNHSLFAGIRRIDEDYFCSDGLALFTNAACGGFPTITANYDVAAYPTAAMGVHYAYDSEKIGFQTSLYNGTGHSRFTGRDNVFRICPHSDGVLGMSQLEYRHKGSHYYLGGSLHYGDMFGEARRRLRPTVWTYAEQLLTDNLILIAAYGHAFSKDNACRNFAGMGGKYTLGKAELGLFSDYTRIDGIDEWATELTCNVAVNDRLSIQPVLHVITTDSKTKCVGVLRLGVNL